MVPMPGRLETEIGGHAIVIGRNNQAWPLANKCRNSWGDSWGDHGDFFLSDDYLLKYGSDAWCVLTNTGA